MKEGQTASETESRLAKIASGEWSPRSWLGTLADAIALFSAVALCAQLISKDDVPQGILAFFLCALALVSTRTVFTLHRQLSQVAHGYQRRAGVADAMPVFAEAAAAIRQATVASMRTDGGNEYLREIRAAMKSLAKGFSTTTGVTCRVTLKEVYAPRSAGERPEDLAVRTVCSSTPGAIRTWPSVDWVRENTDFLKILHDNKPYYLCQDLPSAAKRGEYKNSHWDGTTFATENFEYRSTLIWPIGSTITGQEDPNGEKMDIVGFLCVDTLQTGKFDVSIDVPTGQAFAAVCFPGLDRYIAGREALVVDINEAEGRIDRDA